MIKIIQNQLSLVVAPTQFPDGTSQIWKLIGLDQFNGESVDVEWNWEGNEAELIWINQLLMLLPCLEIPVRRLVIPYLPYARQDKKISNFSTFARETFLQQILRDHLVVRQILSLDVHSEDYRVENVAPTPAIASALNFTGADTVVFPDSGAYNRYNQLLDFDLQVIVLDKVRDQLTGKIEGLTINQELSEFDWVSISKVQDYRPSMLIVDDISDYGGTFIRAANYLKSMMDCDVSLYVTHYLGHGGSQPLLDSGILDIYTTTSLDAYRKQLGEQHPQLNIIR